MRLVEATNRRLQAQVRGSLVHHVARTLPNHPMGLEWFRATAGVKSAGDSIVRLNIDANTPYSLFHKPKADVLKQHRPNPAASTRARDINPLQLAVAAEAARAMPCHKTGWSAVILGDQNRSVLPNLLRQVLADPAGPVGFRFPLGGPHSCQGRNIRDLSRSERDRHYGSLLDQDRPRDISRGKTCMDNTQNLLWFDVLAPSGCVVGIRKYSPAWHDRTQRPLRGDFGHPVTDLHWVR